MNIVLPVIYYAQNFWDKIIEPEVSKMVIKSIMSSEGKATISFQNNLNDMVESCNDQELLQEYDYVCNNTLKNKDLAKIYYDCIYSFLNSYCKTNKIKLNLNQDMCSFELIF